MSSLTRRGLHSYGGGDGLACGYRDQAGCPTVPKTLNAEHVHKHEWNHMPRSSKWSNPSAEACSIVEYGAAGNSITSTAQPLHYGKGGAVSEETR